MKKGLIYAVSGLIVLAVLGVLFLPNFNSDKNDLDEGLSNEKILELIKPEIQSYCADLNAEANYSHCLTCDRSDYIYVENFDEGGYGGYKYMIQDEGDYYLVVAQLHRIAGFNNRPGSPALLTFNIDKNGYLLESDIPEVPECKL